VAGTEDCQQARSARRRGASQLGKKLPSRIRVNTGMRCPPIIALKCPLVRIANVRSALRDHRRSSRAWGDVGNSERSGELSISPQASGAGSLLDFFGAGLGSAEQYGAALLFEAVALTLDVQGRRVAQERVKNRRGQDLVVEDLAPIQKALVRSSLYDQAGFFARQRQVADLVDDQYPSAR
jgi:hypothetical protein